MKRVFVGAYSVPPLSNGQSYYCKGLGCGDCKPKKVQDYTYRETRGDVIIREDYYEFDAADCCGGDIGIWDNVSECDVDFDFNFEGAK